MEENHDFNSIDDQLDREKKEQMDGDNIVLMENHEYIRYIKVRNIIYYILGVVEVLLLLRLLFRLLGANQSYTFIALLYALTRYLVTPFYGIFKTFKIGGPVSLFVFEPYTVIAMAVYAIAALGIVKLFRVRIAENT